ncbi:hypothetical protein [Nitrosomonas sp. Nm58]|uniref:hypothetical protein n=1 Tax=Nitrosomonas sp. Nm58 TaxID=200126 RepID=UPI00089ABC0F|nr:hypothetical protein [Nitrosomonas sp. Nm58]SDY39693.1 hypothetical protein SAMN05421754_100891 [Nitrosomonas sp. Nm58]
MTIQANAQGVVTGKFTIPAGLPAGTKRVRFNGAGGSHGDAVFVGNGTITSQVLRSVSITTLVFSGLLVDPLAQTFSLEQSAQIAAIDLWFSAKGSSDVVVQIRETSNGVPNQSVIGEARLAPSAISTTVHTRITLTAPIQLLAGVEYALVVMCDDAVTEMRIAELGKWDAANGRWVTSQPYQVGVLLSSSNASTWTAHQDRDLAFRLHKAVFTQTNKTVSLGSIAVTDATDLMLIAAEELPSSVTRIEYELSLPGGETVSVSTGQPVRLTAAVTGNISISAKMYGSANVSPILFPGTQLVVGSVSANGDYVSRAIKGGTSISVKVLFDAIIPGGSSVTVKYKGVDAGDTWATVPYVSSSPIDDGFYEMKHEIAGISEDMIQIKLELTGATSARPRVKNLRFMTI